MVGALITTRTMITMLYILHGHFLQNDLVYNKADHVLLTHVAYSHDNHDAAWTNNPAMFTTELIEFREDGFMSFTDATGSSDSIWTTSTVTLPEQHLGQEDIGLHISADIGEGGWIEVSVTKDANGVPTPVSNLVPTRIDNVGSYYIGDILDIWSNKSNVLYGLSGEDVAFTFTFSNAKIYGFSFGEAGNLCLPFGNMIIGNNGIAVLSDRTCSTVFPRNPYPAETS